MMEMFILIIENLIDIFNIFKSIFQGERLILVGDKVGNPTNSIGIINNNIHVNKMEGRGRIISPSPEPNQQTTIEEILDNSTKFWEIEDAHKAQEIRIQNQQTTIEEILDNSTKFWEIEDAHKAQEMRIQKEAEEMRIQKEAELINSAARKYAETIILNRAELIRKDALENLIGQTLNIERRMPTKNILHDSEESRNIHRNNTAENFNLLLQCPENYRRCSITEIKETTISPFPLGSNMDIEIKNNFPYASYIYNNMYDFNFYFPKEEYSLNPKLAQEYILEQTKIKKLSFGDMNNTKANFNKTTKSHNIRLSNLTQAGKNKFLTCVMDWNSKGINQCSKSTTYLGINTNDSQTCKRLNHKEAIVKYYGTNNTSVLIYGTSGKKK